MTEYNGDKLAYPAGKYCEELDKGCSSNEKHVVQISVPLTGIGVVKRVVKLANADARDLTSKGFIAAFQLGFIAGRVAVRLVITTRNIPSGLIIRVPHFWGTRRAPG